ncbi:MAG TPA: alpha/beta hydrolase [Jatrophihabitantaceae bacterium]|jgi:acetyl esterase/lipase|nr:alpha/beta hydrolase [Jatrophihabitantaceae bacterium]
MGDRFLTRQATQLGLTVNATRPIPGGPASVPAFFAGWLTAELAPHLAAATALDAGAHLIRHGASTRRDRLGLALAVANLAVYGSLIRAGNRAKHEIEDALTEALGPEYADDLGRPTDPADLATPWRQLLWPFRMRHVDVVAKRHLPYAPGGRRFLLDVYHHRDQPSGLPVLLQVHGGGWVIGTKEQQGLPLMLQMAAHGWVSVAVNYPLSPRAKWPEHLIALKRAMAWIRENIEEFGGDPSFVAVTGGSAGAHLAAMLALTSGDRSLQPGFEDVDTAVQACVPHYGVYDFTAESGTKFAKQRLNALLRPMVMGRAAQYPEAYRAASPLSRIGDDVPPFFVIHGRNDTLVPVPEARAFVDKLRAASPNPVAYAEVGGAQHAFDIFPSIRSAHVVRGVQRFLDWAYERSRSAAPQKSVAG